jgi:hypothetical protein
MVLSGTGDRAVLSDDGSSRASDGGADTNAEDVRCPAMFRTVGHMEVSPTAPPLLAFAVPAIEALMDGMKDDWSFEVL